MKPILHLIQATDASAGDLLRLGMGSSTRALIDGFAPEYEVHYYTADAEDHSAALNVHHHPLGLSPRWPKPLRWIVYNLRLIGAASRMKGPVRSLGPNLPALPYLRRRGCAPLIIDFGYDWAETTRRHYSGWKRRLARPVQRRSLAAADLVVATTSELARAARAAGARRVIRIPNYVDPSVFHPREPRRPVVLYAGRLHWAKGVEILVRAFLEARQRHPDFALHLYGDGEEAGRLAGLVPPEAEDFVFFHGSRPQEEIAERLGSARVAALPTLTSEGMPKGILEAFASGTPILGTSVPGIAGLVEHDGTGLLVPPGDVAALAAALDALLSDPVVWARLSACGLRKARWFSAERLFRHQRRAMRAVARSVAAAEAGHGAARTGRADRLGKVAP